MSVLLLKGKIELSQTITEVDNRNIADFLFINKFINSSRN